VDSLSSATLTSCDKSVLHVRLELIDETFLTRSKNWIARKLKVIWARDFTTFSLFLNYWFANIKAERKYQCPPRNCFRTQNLLMVLLTVLLALSSVSHDIGQPYCRLLSFRKSLEAMRSGLRFIIFFTTVIDSHPDLTNALIDWWLVIKWYNAIAVIAVHADLSTTPCFKLQDFSIYNKNVRFEFCDGCSLGYIRILSKYYRSNRTDSLGN